MLFVALNVGRSPRLALDIAITVVLGATTTGAVGYLLAERILRPMTRAALAARLPERPVVPALASAAALERAGEDERGCWELGEEVELRGRGEPTRVAAPSAEASVGGSRHG